MAIEIYVLLHASSLPSAKIWQTALDSLGTSIAFCDRFEPGTDSGFVPCMLRGNSTGFEFFLETSEDLVETYPDLAVGKLNLAAAFRFGGDPNECIAAISAAASLAMLADGILFDPEENLTIGGAEAREYALRTVAEFRET